MKKEKIYKEKRISKGVILPGDLRVAGCFLFLGGIYG